MDPMVMDIVPFWPDERLRLGGVTATAKLVADPDIETGADVEGACTASPPYCALTLYAPPDSSGKNVATPAESRAAVPMAAPPLRNLIVPVGTGPDAPPVEATRMVSGVLPPAEDVVRSVFVGIAVIISESEPELASLLPSPE